MGALGECAIGDFGGDIIFAAIIADASDEGDDFAGAPFCALGECSIGDAQDGDMPTNIAGANSITVNSTSGMSPFDMIAVAMDDGTFLSTTIGFINNNVIQLSDRLPRSVSLGNQVTDYATL